MKSSPSFRDIATSLTTLIFIVLAVTGVMMFFHILDNYTKLTHEMLGLAFVIVAVLHTIANWNALKRYFSKKVFLISFVLIALIVSFFIYRVGERGTNPKTTLIVSMLQTNIVTAAKVLKVDEKTLSDVFTKKGIQYKREETFSEISKKNNTSPFSLVSLLTEEEKE